MRFSAFKTPPRPLLKLDPKPSYLAILDVLQDYDVLPSTYIKAAFPSPAYTEDCLTQLLKAKLVEIAPGYEHFMALYRVRPLAITELGEKYLRTHGRRRVRHKDVDPFFKHRYLKNVLKYHRNKLPAKLLTPAHAQGRREAAPHPVGTQGHRAGCHLGH
jgi:hypothetical protein